MKKLIFIVLLVSSWVFSQATFYNNETISDFDDGFAYTVSSSDSIFFYNDTLWIASADSIDIYLPIKRTLGLIKVKGTVTGTIWLTDTRQGVASNRQANAGAGAAAITFKIGPHNGNGSTDDAEIAFAPSTLGSFSHTASAGDSTTGFSYYPLETVSALKDQATAYYTLRLVGTSGNIAGVVFKLEYIDAY